MGIREVIASEKIAEDQNKIALEYGPLVYAVEEADNADVDGITVNSKTSLKVTVQPDLLHGVHVIQGSNDEKKFTAIPYYSWSNRGIGKMKVWLPKKE